jgi:hypothetical protein
VVPNPASDYVEARYLSAGDAEGKIRIMDVIGKERYAREASIESGMNSFIIDTRKLSPGVYFVSLEEGSHNVTKKLIIK